MIVAIVLVLAELAYFKVARKYNIIDKPNLRSSHTQITLRGGGVIFYFGALCFFVVYGGDYPWFMLGLTMIAVVSFVDDVHSVPNRMRIVVQFVAMLLMFCQLGILRVEDWWIVLIALVVCTGIINAYNFMDGINGITGAYSMAVLIPLALENRELHYIDQSLIWITATAVLIFCFFNFRKRAKCFAGDVGSVSIAFILLFIWGALVLNTGQLWYLVYFAVYGADSVLTILHRIMLRENIFKPHRKHMYQLMANELKMPHMEVSSFYFALQVVISFGAIYLPINKWLYFGCVCGCLGIIYVLFMKKNYYLHEQYLAKQAVNGQ